MSKTFILLSLLVLVVSAAFLVHRSLDRGRKTTAPVYTDLLRSVSQNQLISPRDPNVTLKFGSDYRHIGGQKFILYGTADTEQHFFVETTADNQLKSLYWIQFEAYLPDHSQQYNYEDSPSRIRLNDFEFYLDTEPIRSDPSKRRRGSDGTLAREFVRSRGYEFPQDFAYARLVFLTDASRRKELMIVFIDDLATSGLTAPELSSNGSQAARWPKVEKKMLEKIRADLTLITPKD